MWAYNVIIAFLLVSRTKETLFESDGVLIQNRGDTRIASGAWTIVVTINPPKHSHLSESITGLSRSILGSNSGINKTDVEYWLGRLKFLNKRIQGLTKSYTAEHPTHRIKRGLLNIIGSVAHSLFGVATDAEVAQVREAVIHVHKNELVLHHQIDALRTVLDATRAYAITNNNNIRITDATAKVALRYAIKSAHDLIRQSSEIGKLQVSEQLDRVLNMLEDSVYNYVELTRIYNHQRIQLWNGQLTPELIDYIHMEAIRDQIVISGLVPLTMIWYYTHMTVFPIWESSQKSVFRVMFPTIRPTPYLRYHINYYPVVLNDVYLRRLLGMSDIVFNTASRAIVSPNHCHGAYPIVCWPSPEDGEETCESSILSGQGVELCSVKLSRRGNISLHVETLFPQSNIAVVIPFVRSVRIFKCCPGQHPRAIEIDIPHIVKIDPPCHLELGRWSVHGVALGSQRVDMTMKFLFDLPKLDINWPKVVNANISMHISDIQGVVVKVSDLIKQSGIPNISVNTDGGLWDSDSWNDMKFGHMQVNSVVIIIVIIVVIIIIGGYCMWKKRRNKSRGDKSDMKVMKHEIVVKPIQLPPASIFPSVDVEEV